MLRLQNQLKLLLSSAELQFVLRRGVGFGRYTKRTLLVLNDFVLLGLAVWIAFSLRYGHPFVPPNLSFALLMAAGPLLTVLSFFELGIYRMVTRYISGRAFNRIALGITLSVLGWSLVIVLSGRSGVPRLSLLIYAVVGATLIWSSRQVAGWLLKSAGIALPPQGESRSRRPVIVYGAGAVGVQLAGALERSERYVPVGYIDRTPSLWGQYIGGYKVFRPTRLEGLIESFDVSEVIVALPQESRQERASVLRELERFPVAVRTLPAFDDIADGKVTVSALRPVDATDLLGRDPVPPDDKLLARNTAGQSVMVTGAGGSIGSELVRQILRQGPAKLVLYEASENALYEIDGEAAAFLAQQRLAPDFGTRQLPTVHTILGNVLDRDHMLRVVRHFKIDTIYHAAAYKHVPIVEANPALGIANNTLGTLTAAEVAEEAGVKRFVLISTDKAVRPTSTMGASKRLAEMILQSRAARPGQETVFTMVRFGNVLDSSGSVVRLFRRQIEAGGPVTVTHPDMIRYFMSIPEAASLVIQAGAMADGGEVFVLDMGEPVKIDDLAQSMIRLMGLEVRSQTNPTGDIAIEYIGLRPGEKLREELLIGPETSRTEHPRVQTIREPFPPMAQIEIELKALTDAVKADDATAIEAILSRTVEGFRVATPKGAPRSESATSDPWTTTPSKALH